MIEKICKKMGLQKRMRRKVLLGVLFCCVMLCSCASGEQDELTWKLELEEQSQQEVSEEQSQDEMSEADKQEASKTMIYVYVCGAVVQPGVYEVCEGSRVYEVVALAGGLTEEADDTCINMARVIADGEQIIILTQEEALEMQNTSSAVPGKTSQLVNINTASIHELIQLSGIGESRAQAIISYREEKGAFQSIDQIKKVSGIKDGLYEKIKDYITVG